MKKNYGLIISLSVVVVLSLLLIWYVYTIPEDNVVYKGTFVEDNRILKG
ncbi:hypothetical protein [Natranaerovirga pectinivora]|nr:hypothetical protein [Natranaerovirga pectinivora]